MGVIKPKIEKHFCLSEMVDLFCDNLIEELPSLEEGSFERQSYKAAVMVDTAMEHVESAIEHVKEVSVELEKEVKCTPGCSTCCSLPVNSTFAEALFTSVYLTENPSLKEKFNSEYVKWKRNIGEPLEFASQASMGGRLTGNERKSSRKVECPFLGENNCSIYPARPLACRTHISSSDPYKCRQENILKTIVSSDYVEYMSNKVKGVNKFVCKSMGLKEPTKGLFPILVSEILEHKKRCIDKYNDLIDKYNSVVKK